MAGANDLWYGTAGPRDARIVIVGEAWGVEESGMKRPFVGGAGNELKRMLAEAGINIDDCLLTNVVAARPPNNEMWRFFHDKDSGGVVVRGLHPTQFVLSELDRLYRQVNTAERSLIVGCGNYPLWAFTNCSGYDVPGDSEGRRCPNGIMNWRGSMWYTDAMENKSIRYLPIVHPAAILREWKLRAVTVHDLKARVPLALAGDWRHREPPLFWAPPTFEQAQLKLRNWITRANNGETFRLSVDVETAKKLLTCIGFADSPNFAMSIPFVKNGSLESYWTIQEEVVLLDLIRRLLTHPNIFLEGQNFIYDIQYFDAYLAARPTRYRDSMLMHHLLWPGTPKALEYLSSLYCYYHWFWKEDGKEWNTTGELADLLYYNCWDCVRTFEIITTLIQLIEQLGMAHQWEETQARALLALRMMLRGVRIDRKHRGDLKIELTKVHDAILHELLTIVPQSWLPPWKKGAKKTFWPSSPKQQQIVFGDLLGMKLPRHRKTGRPTLGKDALEELPRKHPEWTGLFRRLKDLRSVGVFMSHFINANLDSDDRMRCEYNPAGTETFRWNSSRNAFGRGTNLQNIPRGDEE